MNISPQKLPKLKHKRKNRVKNFFLKFESCEMTYKCFIYLESERKDKKVKQYSKINDPKQSTGESPIKTVRVQWSVAYYIQMNKG